MNKNFYSIYKNKNKWIRIDGEGINPENCNNIHWSSSPNATADLIYMLKFQFRYTPLGMVNFSDFSKNIRIQISRFAYIIPLEYEYSESFMGNENKTQKIEINLFNLEKKEISVKGFRDKKGFWHRPHKRNIKDISKKYTSMMPYNVEKIISLNDYGIVGGIHDEDSHIIKFRDGTTAIYKIMNKGEIIGETSTYNISKILNWNIIPETVEGNFGKGNGSCQQMIDGVEPYAGYEGNNTRIYRKHFDDLAKIFVLDMFLGNPDRHEANVIIDDTNKCWGIDNEFIGTPRTPEKFMSVLDSMCGLSSDFNYNSMIIWLKKNLDRNDFLEFRKYVLKYIKEVLNKKEEILNYYNKYKNDSITVDIRPIKDVILNIKNNLEYMERIK